MKRRMKVDILVKGNLEVKLLCLGPYIVVVRKDVIISVLKCLLKRKE